MCSGVLVCRGLFFLLVLDGKEHVVGGGSNLASQASQQLITGTIL